MEFLAKTCESKLVQTCSYPLTSIDLSRPYCVALVCYDGEAQYYGYADDGSQRDPKHR